MKIIAMNMRANRYRMSIVSAREYMSGVYYKAVGWLFDYGFIGDTSYFDKREFLTALRETSPDDFRLLVDVSSGEVATDRRMVEFASVVAKDEDFRKAVTYYLDVLDYECYSEHNKASVTPMIVVGNFINDKAVVPLDNAVWSFFVSRDLAIDINPCLHEAFGVENITSFGSDVEKYFMDLILSKRIKLDGENGEVARQKIDKYYADFEATRSTKCVCEPYYNHIFVQAYNKIQELIADTKTKGYDPVFMSANKVYFKSKVEV